MFFSKKHCNFAAEKVVKQIMGTYINIGNIGFRRARNSEYVDKSELIAIINSTLNTERGFTCVTRCRRFGKSMAAKMLNAYYDQSCDSRSLFADLEIAKDSSFEKHLNKYPVIYLDTSDFVTRFHDDTIVEHIDAELKDDILEAYPNIHVKEDGDLMECLIQICASSHQQFIFIIDEWDAICREFKSDTSAMDRYVNWLRRMFKGGQSMQVFAGVYMTGILPIKKYKTQSALNNFIEYSMVDPRRMAGYFGFTKDEVQMLSAKYGMDYDELAKWYDGYRIGAEPSIFNPNSVMQAIDADWCTSYWGKSATYETIVPYIKMNFDGLKDDIIKMLAGDQVKVNTTKFSNDLSVVESKDDVLTVLVHLGYLSYDRQTSTCRVPNIEVMKELTNAVELTGWENVVKTLQASDDLLKSILQCDEEAVARGVDIAHDENTSILSYNDENSLACVLSLAFYSARNNYIFHRELPTGKGFADLVLIPRKNVESPAIILELKYNQDADTAIDQIKRKQYPAKVAEYVGNILLVGINYDKQQKSHTCRIERC